MPSEVFQCAECGTVYVVTTRRLDLPVSGTAVCDVCQKVMSDWRGNLGRTFELPEQFRYQSARG